MQCSPQSSKEKPTMFCYKQDPTNTLGPILLLRHGLPCVTESRASRRRATMFAMCPTTTRVSGILPLDRRKDRARAGVHTAPLQPLDLMPSSMALKVGRASGSPSQHALTMLAKSAGALAGMSGRSSFSTTRMYTSRGRAMPAHGSCLDSTSQTTIAKL